MNEKLRKVLQPVLQQQTLYQLNQMKSFVDNSLREVISRNFENDSEKINYLLNVLGDIRDFAFTQTNENAVRISIIKTIEKLEQEELLGNSLKQQEEKSLLKTEESPEQDPKDSKIKEVEVESTPNS